MLDHFFLIKFSRWSLLFYFIIREILKNHQKNNKLLKDQDISNLILHSAVFESNSDNCIIKHYSGSPFSVLNYNISPPLINVGQFKKPRQKDYEKFFNRSLSKFDPRGFEFGDYEAEISSGYEISTPKNLIPTVTCSDTNDCRITQVNSGF